VDVWRRTIFNNWDKFLTGLIVTAEICFIGFTVAVVLGLIACLIKKYVTPLRFLANFYIQFCRNTPIYVQLMWVNYVWPDIIGWPTSSFAAGWMALALQSSGYLAETFRTGIEGITRGHIDAAHTLGMSFGLTMRRIIIPQAFLNVAPSIMNQFLVLAKSSTLVSVIAVPDLMYQALRLTSIWFEPIEILSFTAFLYVVIVFVLSNAIKRYTDKLRFKYMGT
jgi:polar amino acid transport system permease protein